jgi:type VI secretion system protein ImpA
MNSIDELLEPISDENPSGTNLRYSPEFDAIKEARREDPDVAQGDWIVERRTADYRKVLKLTTEVLRSKTKDLQIAVWLTEANTHLKGFEGLAAGLRLVMELLLRFWDSLYPEIEDGDAEMRAAVLEWLGGYTDKLVKSVPLTSSGLNYYDYGDAQAVGHEADAVLSLVRSEQMERARTEGKTTGDKWDASVLATTRAFYEKATADVTLCANNLAELIEVSDRLFGVELAPTYGKLEHALSDVRLVCERLLWQKEPAMTHAAEEEVNVADALTTAEISGGQNAAPLVQARVPAEDAAPVKAHPSNHAEAIEWIVGGANRLREDDPYSPTAYRLIRILRWGELRAAGRPVDPAVLTAPPTTVRQDLRSLAASKEWGKLLSAAESAVAAEYGRGWLDLQRHTYRACEQLGEDYRDVRLAIRTEVRDLLRDFPELLTTCLSDDTPTANSETIAWLRESVLPHTPGERLMDATATANDTEDMPEPVSRILARATQQAARDDYQGAINTVTAAISRQTSPRLRFRLKSYLGAYCLSAGFKAMARSILQELVEQIETLRLDEWESPEEIAGIYAGLYQCFECADGHTAAREALYARICRLDPAQAPAR